MMQPVLTTLLKALAPLIQKRSSQEMAAHIDLTIWTGIKISDLIDADGAIGGACSGTLRGVRRTHLLVSHHVYACDNCEYHNGDENCHDKAASFFDPDDVSAATSSCELTRVDGSDEGDGDGEDGDGEDGVGEDGDEDGDGDGDGADGEGEEVDGEDGDTEDGDGEDGETMDGDGDSSTVGDSSTGVVGEGGGVGESGGSGEGGGGALQFKSGVEQVW
eukprot:CAMPEP_0115845534 /NCGR_PEP_ID=MMETSP0287-20121206/9402_1 /TAXON_ID=412157 /ORGANISM="Chrysochromulina rotalis, Strain UIO044" /LENGTH=217 /DNA_ID=CAMNT_0003299311 /DNA_START=221 /DNA_END=873 /DNA_ORIENTATION=+